MLTYVISLAFILANPVMNQAQPKQEVRHDIRTPGCVFFEINGPGYLEAFTEVKLYSMQGVLFYEFEAAVDSRNLVLVEPERLVNGKFERLPKGRYQVIVSRPLALDKRIVFDYDPKKALVLPKVVLQYGDVDGDGELTKEDGSYIKGQFGRRKDQDGWLDAHDDKLRSPVDADLNLDGVVDHDDYGIFMVAMQKKHDKPLVEKK